MLTDWMAGRMIRLGYTQELDEANIPNKDNVLANLADVDFDPGRTHSLPWQSGFAGIAWNKEELPDGLTSVSDLWTPELKGRVEVLDEMRDTIGPDHDRAGRRHLRRVVRQRVRRGAGGARAAGRPAARSARSSATPTRRTWSPGDALAVIGWSGDITQINFESGDKWEFAIPDAGGTLWTDNMMVPIGSPHKTNAETLMNYYYDPAVAAQVAAWVNYICPVKGAQEAMVDIDPELAENPYIFPTDEFLANVKLFRSLSADEETEFTTQFQEVIGR